MLSVRFENKYNTQVRIDETLYELPYRVKTIIEFSNIVVFLCVPDYSIDPDYLIDAYKSKGKVSLYAIEKSQQKILWTMKEVNNVFVEIPENKKVDDFLSKEHYDNYMRKLNNKNLLSVYVGEFRKLVDANTGNIISSMEAR